MKPISKQDLKYVFFCIRMVPDTFELLLGAVGPKYVPKFKRGDGIAIDAKKASLIGVFYLAHKDTYVEIADRFNVAESSAVYEVEYIIYILGDLRSRYICWPQENHCYGIARQFQDRAGFPGIKDMSMFVSNSFVSLIFKIIIHIIGYLSRCYWSSRWITHRNFTSSRSAIELHK